MTRRLLLSYLAITLVVLVLLEVPLGFVYSQRERDQFTSEVERDANVIATIYEDALEAGVAPDPKPAEEYHSRTGARVVVTDRAGTSLLDTGGGVDRDFATRPEIETALTGRRAAGIRHSNTLGASLLYVAVPVASSGVVHGALRITLAASRVDGRIRRFWAGLGAVGGIILVIAALVSWALARSLSRPILRMNAAAARYAQGDLDPPSEPPSGPGELRNLASTMATMAVRLDALIEEQRSFVADASHQLRTPLTALRLRLENLQTRLAGADADEVTAIIGESERLNTLVSDLLQLARADQSRPSEEIDLASLAAERAQMWSATADLGDVHIDVQVPPDPVRALATPGAVEQILDNLLDNAINASPPGSTIAVVIAPEAKVQRLAVVDRGRGLSDEDKARATRRFWRGMTPNPGTGLGLAIVEALVKVSGGELALTDTDPQGLTVTVTLPAG
jgi:signal transduction histidine kinase